MAHGTHGIHGRGATQRREEVAGESGLGAEADAEDAAGVGVDADRVDLREGVEEAVEIVEAEAAADRELLRGGCDGDAATVILGEAGEGDVERLFVENDFALAPREGVVESAGGERQARDTVRGGREPSTTVTSSSETLSVRTSKTVPVTRTEPVGVSTMNGREASFATAK